MASQHTASGYRGAVDLEALAALVPRLMAVHSGITWEFIDITDGFVIELHPTTDRTRSARVEVSASTAVFGWTFAGHHAADNAYDLDDKQETLAEQISVAVAAVRGPSEVVLEWAGQQVVRSGISHDAAPDDPPEFTTSYPIERFLWRAKGKHFRREIMRFPAIPDVE